MKLSSLIKELQRIYMLTGEQDVVVRVHQPGSVGVFPNSSLTNVYPGIDWNKGKVFLETIQALTALTPEQVTEITESIKKGTSWHAYQSHQKQQARIDELTEKLKLLKAACQA